MLRLIGGLYPRTNCLETAHHVAHGAAGFGSPVCLVLLYGAAQPKVSKLGSQPSSRPWVGANQHVAGILQQSTQHNQDELSNPWQVCGAMQQMQFIPNESMRHGVNSANHIPCIASHNYHGKGPCRILLSGGTLKSTGIADTLQVDC